MYNTKSQAISHVLCELQKKHKENTSHSIEANRYFHFALFYTNIVTVSPFDEILVLNNGGYRNESTMNLMNEALVNFELPFEVYAEDGLWYLKNKTNNESKLFDNREISIDLADYPLQLPIQA